MPFKPERCYSYCYLILCLSTDMKRNTINTNYLIKNRETPYYSTHSPSERSDSPLLGLAP